MEDEVVIGEAGLYRALEDGGPMEMSRGSRKPSIEAGDLYMFDDCGLPRVVTMEDWRALEAQEDNDAGE